MTIHYLSRDQVISAPIEKVWNYFCSPSNLNEMTPSDMNFEIMTQSLEKMSEGQIIEYRVGIFPGIRSLWLTEISHIRKLEYFVDEQRIGPYSFWYHEHKFFKVDEKTTRMVDNVSYSVGYGWFGYFLNYLLIEKKLSGIFDFRTKKINDLFPPQV